MMWSPGAPAGRGSQADQLRQVYRHLRSVTRKLNAEPVERITKNILDKGGRKLGLMQHGTLVFDSESHMAVMPRPLDPVAAEEDSSPFQFQVSGAGRG